MIFHQYFLECLSQLSYLIGDETSGRAVVVDPRRDIAVYLRDAQRYGLRIEKVIETHCHADFLSGHLELAATGAMICYSEGATVDYPIEYLRDGQRLDLGQVRLEIRATPGHTPESISVVVYEHCDDAAPYGDAQRNRRQRPLLKQATPPPVSFAELTALRSAGVVVLDSREPADFATVHLRGSVNVGLGGRFAEFAGDVLRPDHNIVLVCAIGKELEARIRLGRIGFDNVVGYLEHPARVFFEHPDAVESSFRLTAAQLAARRSENTGLVLVDVRNPGELDAGVICGAVHIPLTQLTQRADELDRSRSTVVHCASGYRSMIAASWLSAVGFVDVSDLLGGYAGWKALANADQQRTGAETLSPVHAA
jgi:rhodanese-related sulfurtransferase